MIKFCPTFIYCPFRKLRVGKNIPQHYSQELYSDRCICFIYFCNYKRLQFQFTMTKILHIIRSHYPSLLVCSNFVKRTLHNRPKTIRTYYNYEKSNLPALYGTIATVSCDFLYDINLVFYSKLYEIFKIYIPEVTASNRKYLNSKLLMSTYQEFLTVYFPIQYVT